MFIDMFFSRVLYVSIIVAILIAVLLIAPQEKTRKSRVYLGGAELSVVVADTPARYEKGLGGKRGLQENEGMFFVFPKPARTGFWMKDMLFPIDIIWFDAEKKIVDIWENAQPNSYPEVRAPKSAAQYVLEVCSGFVRAHNVRVGDQFKLAQ